MVGVRLTRGQRLGYGLGAAGSAGFGTVPGLILAIYLTNTLGVAAGLASLVILIPKLWDVFFLPYVGTLSDRSTVRHGGRSRFLAIGAIGMLVSFPLMFAVPGGMSPGIAAAWVLLAFLIAASAFGFFQVPYIALAAEITDVPAERTTLMSWRVSLQMLGILLFGVGAPLLVNTVSAANAGYLVMGVIIGALICAGMLACWITVRRLPRFVAEPTPHEHRMLHQLRLAWGSRPFRILLTAFVLQALGAGAALAAAPYFSTHILGIENFGLVFGVLLLPAAVFMPMWTVVGHRLGKRRGYLLSAGLFIVGLLASLAAAHIPLAVALLCIAVTSVGYAGMQMFPLAILPDVIDEDAVRTGRQRAGAFTGIWTAGETAAFAFGPALVLIVLAVAGYVSAVAGQTVTQPASAIAGVQLGFSVLPVLLVALSLPLILRFPVADRASVVR